MADIVPKEKRSSMMAGIQGKNTKPEMVIRRILHSRGFRYRLHEKKLPGKPDLTFPKYRAVIQINGCFWHKHECHLFKWPTTRREFWESKINRTAERDRENRNLLEEKGWRMLTVWECSLKGRDSLEEDDLANRITNWLRFAKTSESVTGLEMEYELAAESSGRQVAEPNSEYRLSSNESKSGSGK